MTHRILLILLFCAGLLAPSGDAGAQWIGRMWGNWPNIDYFVLINTPGGRATNTTNPDVRTEAARWMDGLWAYAVDDFNVPSYFEPFAAADRELFGTNVGKMVLDHKADALDFSRTYFETGGDGISPKIFRNKPPIVTQDGASFEPTLWKLFDSRKDQVVPSLTADLLIPLEVSYAGGITERRRLYAWQSPEQDDMFFLIRSYGRPTPSWQPDQRVGPRGTDKMLQSDVDANDFAGLYIAGNVMFIGGNGQGPAGEARSVDDIESNSKWKVANLGAVGEWDELYFFEDDLTRTIPAADALPPFNAPEGGQAVSGSGPRAVLLYGRDGDSAIAAGYRPDGDDRGEPAPPAGHQSLTLAAEARITAGEFMESHYKGKLWLYASTVPMGFQDFPESNNAISQIPPTDDTAQPHGLQRVDGNNWVSTDRNTRAQTYDFIVQPGLTTRAERIATAASDAPDFQPTEVADHTFEVTWGPYTLGQDQWVHTVEAWIVAGPHTTDNQIVGGQWSSGAISFAEKEAFLDSGLDSLMQGVDQARQAWENRVEVAGTVNGGTATPITWPIGWSPSLPLGPSWPATASYNSGPEQNEISWSSVTGAVGYNLYRMAGHETNLADPPIPRNGSTLLTGTSFTDTDVIRGERNFYSVTAVDAKGQESSIFATRNGGNGVSSFSQPVNDLTQVRVVPNPYSILGGDLSGGGTNFTGQPNKLLFVNLPANAIIRIFTLNGDLVTRLDHTTGSGDEEWALMANDNNQFIVSGVYVAHITDPASGQSDIEKFVVVR